MVDFSTKERSKMEKLNQVKITTVDMLPTGKEYCYLKVTTESHGKSKRREKPYD